MLRQLKSGTFVKWGTHLIYLMLALAAIEFLNLLSNTWTVGVGDKVHLLSRQYIGDVGKTLRMQKLDTASLHCVCMCFTPLYVRCFALQSVHFVHLKASLHCICVCWRLH